MILVVGIISIIQAVFLPGFVATFVINDVRVVDRILLSLPLSLSINYVLVLFLVLVGSYNYQALYMVVAIELAVLLIFMLKSRANGKIANLNINMHCPESFHVSLEKTLIGSLVLLFSMSLIYFIWSQVGTVIDKWDAICSWNHWAVSWYLGLPPHGTWQYPGGSQTYPQAIPILYSLTYVFLDDIRVQFFAKFIAILFPLAAWVTLLRIATISEELRKYTLLVIPIVIYQLGIIGGDYYGLALTVSANVDGIMAYYGVFVCYVYILIYQRPKSDVYSARFFILTVTAVAGVAAVKQPGVFLAVLFPFAWFYYIGRWDGRSGVNRLIWACLISFLFAGPWYIYKAIQIYSGDEISLVSQYSEIISRVWYLRPIYGIQMIFDQHGWAWLPAFILGLRCCLARKILLWGILPVFILWSFVVSYDMRSLSLALPWFAFILAIGCYEGWNLAKNYKMIGRFVFTIWLSFLLISILQDIPTVMAWPDSVPKKFLAVVTVLLLLGVLLCWLNRKWRVSWIAATVIVVSTIGILSAFLPSDIDNKMISRSIYLQKKIGHFVVNDYLLAYFSDPHRIGYIATDYQLVGFIPGLQQHYKRANCGETSLLDDKSIKYYLWSDVCKDRDIERFETKLEAGNFTKHIINRNFFFYEVGSQSIFENKHEESVLVPLRSKKL